MRRSALCLALVLASSACSPIYVLKAGIAEARILRSRRPIPEVILDARTDERTRSMLRLAMDARDFAIADLHLDVGKSYTTFARLRSDTLAHVLSAARKDRLEPRTWWFPVVGRFPYKGYFDLEDARDAQRDLEEEGWDTYLRPTAAFSTLGWFEDPLLSTLLRADDVDLIETILHELSHNHLFVKGQVMFNESFAEFVGRVGAAEFFCTRDGGGPDTVKCARARARWRDEVRFSRFIDALVEELRAVYGRADLTTEQKLAERERVFAAAKDRFRSEVQPSFEAGTFNGFLSIPLNNATLLARMVYYHRLADFDALLRAHGGDLAATVAELKAKAPGAADAYALLPKG